MLDTKYPFFIFIYSEYIMQIHQNKFDKKYPQGRVLLYVYILCVQEVVTRFM